VKCTIVADSCIGVCKVQGWDTSSSVVLILIYENLHHLVQKLEGGGRVGQTVDRQHIHTDSMVMSFLERAK